MAISRSDCPAQLPQTNSIQQLRHERRQQRRRLHQTACHRRSNHRPPRSKVHSPFRRLSPTTKHRPPLLLRTHQRVCWQATPGPSQHRQPEGLDQIVESLGRSHHQNQDRLPTLSPPRSLVPDHAEAIETLVILPVHCTELLEPHSS